jgi:hypothetical protein
VFIDTNADLIESVINFMETPELWRAAVGSHPKYFVHYQSGNKHYFGLSKYCAFKDAKLDQYVANLRRKTGGGAAQKRISRVSGRSWIALNRANATVQPKFKGWFLKFFPGYDLKEVSIISLAAIHGKAVSTKRCVSIAPTVLAKKLLHQELIGAIGEEIAYQYETQRLANLGIRHPAQWVDQVSKSNAAAGFDISSLPPRRARRFIEVKSHTSRTGSFYITRNQIETLRTFATEAYLYLVCVTNTRARKGRVVEVVRNPVAQLETRGRVTPILYEAELSPS